ncbi:hypothetical protein ABW20_dc0107360 [Dactylellina cionopaga]|nr:hypothetical protein ABW20_dc0107360 [Dactylellina cionopaga]
MDRLDSPITPITPTTCYSDDFGSLPCPPGLEFFSPSALSPGFIPGVFNFDLEGEDLGMDMASPLAPATATAPTQEKSTDTEEKKWIRWSRTPSPERSQQFEKQMADRRKKREELMMYEAQEESEEGKDEADLQRTKNTGYTFPLSVPVHVALGQEVLPVAIDTDPDQWWPSSFEDSDFADPQGIHFPLDIKLENDTLDTQAAAVRDEMMQPQVDNSNEQPSTDEVDAELESQIPPSLFDMTRLQLNRPNTMKP